MPEFSGAAKRGGVQTNTDESTRLRLLALEGKCCSSILVAMGLALRGEENDRFVEAAAGLCEGMYSGLVCGCLTGAACMLGLFGGRGAAPMVLEMTEWFTSEYGEKYGGISCGDITEGDRFNRTVRCPEVVAGTYERAKAILIEHGHEV